MVGWVNLIVFPQMFLEAVMWSRTGMPTWLGYIVLALPNTCSIALFR